MKKFLIIALLVGSMQSLMAQERVRPVNTVKPVTPTKPAAKIIPTKTLKKQMASAMKRKKYSQVIPMADTLLKRNKKDEDAFSSKFVSQVMIKRDNDAIATIKKWFKNKDSAASIIAAIPAQFDFAPARNSNLYYKSAIAMAPKNGIPYLFYAANLVDKKSNDLAMLNAKKGYALLPLFYKRQMSPLYATINFEGGNKEEAYKEMEKEIEDGNTEEDIISTYFKFYKKDDRLQDGIAKATELIAKDSLGNYFVQRGIMYNLMGNSDNACMDAQTLKEVYGEEDYWLRRFKCKQILADATPTMQSTYVYNVNFSEQDYDFRVSSPKINMNDEISFKYKLTGDVGYAGTVSMSKDAVATAHGQMNKFGAEKIELTDRTSVWISKEVFNELKTNGTSLINANDWVGSREFTVVSEADSEDTWFPVEIDGETKYLRCIKIEDQDGQEIWINDDENNPLILKMNVDFTISLRQIF